MSSEKCALTGPHVVAARGLLRMTQEDLAKAADVSVPALIRLETGSGVPRASTVEAVRGALERRGIEFSNGDEPGVRLRPSKAIIPV